jgi:hypothetical protein
MKISDDVMKAFFTALWGDHWVQEDLDAYANDYRPGIAAAIQQHKRESKMSSAKKGYWAAMPADEKRKRIEAMRSRLQHNKVTHEDK